MIKRLVIVSATLLFLKVGVYAQEICNNGIDDDGDLLVDLNDSQDCSCNSSTSLPILPNPSFEDRSCCPVNHDQLSCADVWLRASTATSDYFNTCGYATPSNTNFLAPADGNGSVGFFNGNNNSKLYKEYIGSCLSGALLSGVDYTIDFQYAGALPTTKDLDFAIFGTTSCSNLPLPGSTGCPTDHAGWIELGSLLVNPSSTSWQTGQISFTPTVDIVAIALGPSCIPSSIIEDVSGGLNQNKHDWYYLLDDLHLTTTNSPPPVPQVTMTTGGCNDPVELDASPTGTGGSFQWYKNGIAIVGATSSNYSVLSGDIGQYQVMLSDGTACAVSNEVLVDNNSSSLQVATSADSTICIGGEFSYSALASGGTGGYTYNWDPPASGANPPAVSLTTPTCFTVTATDNGGCASATATVCASIYPPLQADILSDTTICEGAAVELKADVLGGMGAPYSYDWTNSRGFSENKASISDIPQGNYPDTIWYELTVNDQCETPPVRVNAFVAFIDAPGIDFTADFQKGCQPLNVEIIPELVDPFSCFWDLGDGTVSSSCNNVIHSYEEAGDYDVSLTVTYSNGCENTLQKPTYIQVFPNPTANFSFTPVVTDLKNTMMQFKDESFISGDQISSWQWNFYESTFNSPNLLGTSAQEDPEFQFTNPFPDNLIVDPLVPNHDFNANSGKFPVELIVTTANNCSDTVRKYVTIHETSQLYVPNAFTPNEDQENDIFLPKGVGIDLSKDYYLFVFDRWGRILFESNQFQKGWDGTYKNSSESAPIGVYTWKLEYYDRIDNGNYHRKMGKVTLLR